MRVALLREGNDRCFSSCALLGFIIYLVALSVFPSSVESFSSPFPAASASI